MVLLAGTVLTACTLRESRHYVVQSGWGVYMHIFQRPTDQIVEGLYVGHCKRSVGCTSDFLRTTVRIEGWGAAEWYGALGQHGDFRESLEQLRGNNHCLMLHKDFSADLNWSESSDSRWCKVGVDFDP